MPLPDMIKGEVPTPVLSLMPTRKPFYSGTLTSISDSAGESGRMSSSQTNVEAPKLFGEWSFEDINIRDIGFCLLYTSPSPRD